MTILIDPPTWPAHGTVWAHLVSDSSLHELRLFAREHSIPDRSLDHDHYDVPAHRFDDLVAGGAVPVEGREVSLRLAASGLRVPGWERRRAKRSVLLERWLSLWAPDERPGAGLGVALQDMGEELVDRWREPHRVYHSRLHLADALDALDAVLDAAEAR